MRRQEPVINVKNKIKLSVFNEFCDAAPPGPEFKMDLIASVRILRSAARIVASQLHCWEEGGEVRSQFPPSHPRRRPRRRSRGRNRRKNTKSPKFEQRLLCREFGRMVRVAAGWRAIS